MSEIDFDRIARCVNNPGGNIVIGIDGYIDEVWQIVESRTDLEDYSIYDRMGAFSHALVECNEGGFSNEIIRKRRSYGGFTANTCKAVWRLGVKPEILCMFGTERIDPLFAEFVSSTNLTSVGEPAVCQIYEFSDGKVMLAHSEDVMGFNWSCLTGAIPESKLKSLFGGADIIALGYWSVMHAFDEIVENICRLIRNDKKIHRMFFDFADIRKRSRSSLENTIEKLAELNGQVPMTLSLNEHEAELLFSCYGKTFVHDAEDDEQVERMRGVLGIDELVVHTPYFAAAASASEGCCTMRQTYCESPLITTGAGDNFNGGYIVARLKGLNISERLAFANAATYLYVSRGYSPDKDELLAELRNKE